MIIGSVLFTWDQVLSKLVLKSFDNNWQWMTFSSDTYKSPCTHSMTMYIKYFNSNWEIYVLLSFFPCKNLEEANVTLQSTHSHLNKLGSFWIPISCIPSFKVTCFSVSKIFYHIWAWRPSSSCVLDHLNKISFPPFQGDSTWNLASISQKVSEKLFEIVENSLTLDKGQWMTFGTNISSYT